jgi:hypothetical protein
VRYQLQELTRGVAFYRRLGLEFDKIHDDRLRMVFTLLDRTAPDRRFTFNVRISAGDAYEVDGVDPPLPPAEVGAMVAALNASNDFSAFVRGMRARFAALVAAGK